MGIEIALSGGRITSGISRVGEVVYRPCCPNASFVHRVLLYLERKKITVAPRFLGIAVDGREMISFLEGNAPENLGDFSDAQLFKAGEIVRMLHDALASFPDCTRGQTVCHCDLSPCNFMFRNGLPYAVFDWDGAQIGDPVDDLAYAIWMWCDLGNVDNAPGEVRRRMKIILDAYRLESAQRFELVGHILQQMSRVAASIFPTETQTIATRRWVNDCVQWLQCNRHLLLP